VFKTILEDLVFNSEKIGYNQKRRKTVLSRSMRSSYVDREGAHSTLSSRLTRRPYRQNTAGDFLFRRLLLSAAGPREIHTIADRMRS
jgi:hypothetical protein